MQRQRALWAQQHRQHAMQDGGGPGSGRNRGTCKADARRSVRHSVNFEVPDRSISALYPVDDNYVIQIGGRRSPKSLVNLCIEAVCRSLPNLDGELPPGLPQDLVDAIVKSLMTHAALNATTLRALRHCELGELSLAGCRGVSDEWLIPLSSCSSSTPSPSCGAPRKSPKTLLEPMELDLSQAADRPVQNERRSCESLSQQMECHGEGMTPQYFESVDIHQNTTVYRRGSDHSSSSGSSTSFVSASSTPYVPSEITTKLGSSVAPFKEIMTHSPLQESLPSLTSNLTLLDLRGSQRLTDRGLMQLSDLASLEVVKLDNCHSLVGKGLIAFASSHRLHTISLANCRRLTDEAVVNISHLSSLSAISLDGCRCLTDHSLAAISNLYEVRKLDLSQCDLITDVGLEHLHDLGLIEELSLGWCRSITDRGLQILASQPNRETNLRILRLARCPISDDGIVQIGKLLALEELDLNGCSDVGGAALGSALEKMENLISLDVSYCPGILRVSWQGKIKSLKSLELCYSSVRDAHLSRLSDLPALEELNLDSCPVGDWAVSHLADNEVVPNLTSLDLADTDLTDIGMVHLPKFHKLTRLSLFYCNITNAGLRHLSSMTTLEVLNLDSREIGDEGLSHLRNLNRLRCLDIFSGRITDAGCVHLSSIKSLESLELCGGGVGDLGCAHLGSLELLTSLNLSQNERITNRGAASLAALTNLKALNLSNTRVNSSALRFLGGLLRLQSLALYGCNGIEDGTSIDTLQNELPSLKCLRLNTSSNEDGIVESHANRQEETASDMEAMFSLQQESNGSVSLASSHESGLHDDGISEEATVNGGDNSDLLDSDDETLRLDEMDVAGGGGHVTGQHRPFENIDDDASLFSHDS